MLRCALTICAKDLRLILGRGAGLCQPLLLGLLLIFLFSLSRETGSRISAQSAATIFWMSTAFCQVLLFTMLYGLEESHGARLGLLLLPAPPQSIWLGKGAAGLVLLLAAQTLFIPATAVFLEQGAGPQWPVALVGLALVDLGMAAAGSLLGALSVGRAGRESLLSVVLFPLLLPLLLAGIRLLAAGMTQYPVTGMEDWVGLALAFDALFLGAGLLLFPFVYSGEDG